MNVIDMHIEVNQSLQKIAANKTRKFLNEEIDWVLNKMQQRFIQLCLKPKLNQQGKPVGAFTVDQLRQDALRNLIGSKEIACDITNPRKSIAILPADYSYLLDDRSKILTNCGTDTKTTTVNPIRVINLVPHPGVSPYFTTFSITINGKTVSIPADLDSYNKYSSYLNAEDINRFIGLVLYKLREQGVEAYWERYDDIYKQNSILVSGGTGIVLNYSGSTITGNVTTVNKTITTSLITSSGIYAHNRLEESTGIFELLTTAFYKPSIQSPISELQSNRLIVHTDTNFTVTKVEISYIRKAKPISIILGSNCEIAEEFHQTICDLTVEYLKGRMEHSEGVAMISQDIENRIIL
jgi:hypothetical protein